MLKANALELGIGDRAVADAMNAMPPIGQRPSEVPTDEAIGAGNPYVHGCAL
jgi:hypothetical protein